MDIGYLNECSGMIIDSAMHVHSELGPGLLETSYHVCLVHDLEGRGLRVRSQVLLPITYKRVRLEHAYRVDLLVEGTIIVELKAVSQILPVHDAQVLSYLRLSGCPLGLLINFHVPRLKHGIRRFVNGLA